MYKRQQLDRELKQMLKKPYDLLMVFRWADRLHLLHFEELRSELDDLLLALEAMSLDEKGAYTEEQLNLLADMLINKIVEVKEEKLINYIASQKKLYTRQQLGRELKQILKKSCDPIMVAKWAERLHLNSPEDLSPELDDLLYAISMMSADENFEYTEEQLNLLADKLMNNEENALQQVNKIYKIFEEWQPDETHNPK